MDLKNFRYKRPRPKLTFDRFGQIVFTFREVSRLAFKLKPKLLIFVFVLNGLWGFSSIPIFYIEKLIIDRLIGAIGSPQAALILKGVIILIVFRVLLEYFRNFASSIISFLRGALSRYFHSEIDVLVGKKTSELDLSTLENPEFRDKINKIERESGRRAWGLMMPLSNIPNYSVGFVSSLGLLLLLSPWVVLGIIILTIPQFIVDSRYIKKSYELHTKLSPLHRIWGWLNYYLARNRNFMELKVLKLSGYLTSKLRHIQKEVVDKQVELDKSRTISRYVSSIPVSIFELVVTIWMAGLVVFERITVGSFQMFLRAISNAEQNLTGLVSSFLEIYENYLFVADLVWFLNLEPEIEKSTKGKKSIDKLDSLKFENVWFRYQKDTQWTIKSIDFEIKRGEKIAIVGENGAGKTTIIKLIGRFYDPHKGHVNVNNEDLKEFNVESWRKNIAILFQEFELYPFSVKEAIGYGDLERMEEISELKEAARKAGVDKYIDDLALKYKTPLTPEFEKGTKPSIGQMQRIGIARILFRKSANLLILDEPTSSVDPEAEEKIFNELKKITKDKILIFVTQRFSTVRIADRIFVVDKGKIIEQGTHKELMRKGGKYRRLYTLQARAYTN